MTLYTYIHVDILQKCSKDTPSQHPFVQMLAVNQLLIKATLSFAGSTGLIGNQKSISIGNAISTAVWRFLQIICLGPKLTIIK